MFDAENTVRSNIPFIYDPYFIYFTLTNNLATEIRFANKKEKRRRREKEEVIRFH